MTDPQSRRELEVVSLVSAFSACAEWCHARVPAVWRCLGGRNNSLIVPSPVSRVLQAAKLRAAPHSNIITTHAPMGGGNSVYLPMELASGDLFAMVEAAGPLSEASAKVVFRQVASALAHCHDNGIYHGDVKPENVLLVGGKPVLTDFGSATFNRATSRACSTVLYGSPEAVAVMHAAQEGVQREAVPSTEAARYDAAQSDVWSLGISIVASVSGFMPWEAAHISDRRYHYWAHAVANAARGLPLEVCARLMFGAQDASPVSDALLHLVSGMLHPNPAHRFTLEQVMAHPWMQ